VTVSGKFDDFQEESKPPFQKPVSISQTDWKERVGKTLKLLAAVIIDIFRCSQCNLDISLQLKTISVEKCPMYLADFHGISDLTVKRIMSCTRKEPRDHEIVDKTLHHTTLKHNAFEPGASRLLYYCTPPVTVPAVIGARAVWRQNIKNDRKRQQHPRPWRPRRRVQEGRRHPGRNRRNHGGCRTKPS